MMVGDKRRIQIQIHSLIKSQKVWIYRTSQQSENRQGAGKRAKFKSSMQCQKPEGCNIVDISHERAKPRMRQRSYATRNQQVTNYCKSQTRRCVGNKGVKVRRSTNWNIQFGIINMFKRGLKQKKHRKQTN